MGHGKRPQFDWGELEIIFGKTRLGQQAEVTYLRKGKECVIRGALAGVSITPSGIRQLRIRKYAIPFVSMDINIKSVVILSQYGKHVASPFDLGLFVKTPDTEKELAELTRYYFG